MTRYLTLWVNGEWQTRCPTELTEEQVQEVDLFLRVCGLLQTDEEIALMYDPKETE